MSSVSRVVLILAALLVPGTPAAAADPLLSGYSGPGGGDQTILGSEVLPASAGSGERSLEARAAPAAKGSSSTDAPAGASAAPGDTPAASGAAPQGDGEGKRSGGAAPPASGSASSAADPVVAQPVRYPVSAVDGDAPLLSAGAALGLVLAALLLVGVGVLTARASAARTA